MNRLVILINWFIKKVESPYEFMCRSLYSAYKVFVYGVDGSHENSKYHLSTYTTICAWQGTKIVWTNKIIKSSCVCMYRTLYTKEHHLHDYSHTFSIHWSHVTKLTPFSHNICSFVWKMSIKKRHYKWKKTNWGNVFYTNVPTFLIASIMKIIHRWKSFFYTKREIEIKHFNCLHTEFHEQKSMFFCCCWKISKLVDIFKYICVSCILEQNNHSNFFMFSKLRDFKIARPFILFFFFGNFNMHATRR